MDWLQHKMLQLLRYNLQVVRRQSKTTGLVSERVTVCVWQVLVGLAVCGCSLLVALTVVEQTCSMRLWCKGRQQTHTWLHLFDGLAQVMQC
jgi:hypothetical protein